MNINDYRNKYTKQEFIREIRLGSDGKIRTKDNCPSSWNLTEHKCTNYTNCNDCWYDAVKDIQFKGEEDEFSETSKDNIKWIFNLKQFQDESIAILCPTSTEFDILLKTLITNGMELDKSHYQYSYSDENKDICYDLDCGILEYCDEEWYYDHDYKIYKFSDIDFSQVWNKESIDEVALHNNNKNDFDITKVKYITKEQLSNRGYKTGDVLFDGTSMGIVYGKKVIHINDNCVETLDIRAFDYILPIELIESGSEIQRLLSGKLSGKIPQQYLIDCFIKIEEPPKLKTVCSIKFTSNTNTTKEFILEDNSKIIAVNDIVEANTVGKNYQYAKVVEVKQLELSEHEIENYRTCRKLSL